jgi:hypothetical protein
VLGGRSLHKDHDQPEAHMLPAVLEGGYHRRN